MSSANYPQYRNELNDLYRELGHKIPDVMKGFSSLSGASLKDGALSKKSKELIAVAIGVGKQCDGCIAYHVGGAVSEGASDEEITEAIGVAVLMGGGPASIYACEAIKALRQFRAEEAEGD